MSSTGAAPSVRTEMLLNCIRKVPGSNLNDGVFSLLLFLSTPVHKLGDTALSYAMDVFLHTLANSSIAVVILFDAKKIL
jgi:hypothetical protein